MIRVKTIDGWVNSYQRFMRGVRGVARNNKVHLNGIPVDNKELKKVLVHELLHLLHPDWEEWKIEGEESRLTGVDPFYKYFENDVVVAYDLDPEMAKKDLMYCITSGVEDVIPSFFLIPRKELPRLRKKRTGKLTKV